MNIIFKKVILTALIGAISLSAFGCGKQQDSESDITIEYWNSGYGIEFMNNMKDAFETQYPQYKIIIEDTTDLTGVGNNIVNGKDTGNTTDLYLGAMSNLISQIECVEPLDEMMDEKIDGEDKSINDKIIKDLVVGMKINGNTYALPWTNSPMGIVYNKSVFDSMEYQLPRTTDELIELEMTICDDADNGILKVDGQVFKSLTGKNTVPFISSNAQTTYWTQMIRVWQAQYEGVEAYNNSLSGKWYDENQSKLLAPSINALATRGMYEAFVTLEEVISPKGFSYVGSNGLTHTEAQTYFIQGSALMMVNGAWLENEMRRESNKYEFAMMKSPVISSLGDKLGITEEQLRIIVSYVDGETLSSAEENAIESVSQTVIEEVRTARSIVYNNGGSQRMCIPSYSINKEGAKKFIQFMYSEEGLRIYAEATKAPLYATRTNPIDNSNWSEFQKVTNNLAKNSTSIIDIRNNEFYTQQAQIDLYNWGANALTICFTSAEKASSKTAKEVFKDLVDAAKSKWGNICLLLNYTETDDIYRAVPESLYN